MKDDCSMRNVMNPRPASLLAILLSFALVRPIARAAPAPGIDPGEAALAERFAETARLTLSARYITAAHWKMAAALLEGATKLNPAEPRFSRLWIEAELKADDDEAALRAVKAYLAVQPDDKVALIEYADLFASTFDTTDKRLDYLRDKVDVQLPDEVRSHIAFRAYQVYWERTQYPQAKAMLDKALALNPVNLDALRARYEQLADSGTPAERLAALLDILRANPGQFEYVHQVAQTLAEAGIVKPALMFYNVGLNLSQRMGRGISRDYALACAVELILDNQLAPAKQLVDYVVTVINPADYDALAVRLMLERASDQKDAAAKTVGQLEILLYNRLQEVRKTLGDSSATTRPVDSPGGVSFGSLSDDVKKLQEYKGENADALRASYVQVLAEIAWMETYFRASPADAKSAVEAMKAIAPEDSPSVARLEGWAFLLAGDKDSAKVKLSAVKDRDPLAQLGLIKLMDAGDEATKAGEQLLARHPTGATAALIMDALRDRKVTMNPAAEAIAPLVDTLNKFPKEWVSILDQPQTFYSLRVEANQGRVAHAFAEPMIVRVTITNNSEYPITIAPDGVIHPDLWFDVTFRGVAQQAIPGAGYDRIAREVVLKPRASVSQLVRLDQGQVSQLLASSPFPSMQLVFDVRTNPALTAGGVAPGGQIAMSSKPIERDPFSTTPRSLNNLLDGLAKGDPGQKIQLIDLAAATGYVLYQQQDPQAKNAAMQFFDAIKSQAQDSSPAVAAWATQVLTRVTGPGDRPTAVNRLTSNSYWPARVLGLASMGPMKFDDQLAIARRVLAAEKDPIVLAYGNGLVELLEQASKAATQAATQPGGGAATQPSPLLTPTTQPVPFTQGPSGVLGGNKPATRGADLVIPSDIPLTLPPSATTAPTQPAVRQP
jgi:tetratricopeptide (TPR) repeat protein